MRLRRPIAFILSAAVAASALTGCDSFSGHAAAAANSAQVQQLIEFIADLGLERDLRQALQSGGDLRQALLTLLGLENAVNFNVDDLTGARPGQHAVQVWEVTAQSAEDAAALAASQIRAVLEQLKSNGVTAGRIGMVEVDGKYYVVVDVEVTEENTFEPIRPASDDDDDSEDGTIPGVTVENGLLIVDVADLGLSQNTNITAASIIEAINKKAGTNYTDKNSIKVLDLSGCAGLTSIGDSAFEGCEKLTTVTLPNGLQSIGTEAFQYCSQLTKVTLPESLESIDNLAFAGCESLTSINLSGCKKLKSIGNYAFAACTSLASIDLSGCASLTRIGGVAFAGSDLTEVNLSGCKNLTSIGNGAFQYCASLETVLLPESLGEIGAEAFWSCTDLQSIYFQSVPGIANNAFKDVNAENLTVYYSGTCDLNELKEALRNKGFSGDFKDFIQGPPPLAYLLGL